MRIIQRNWNNVIYSKPEWNAEAVYIDMNWVKNFLWKQYRNCIRVKKKPEHLMQKDNSYWFNLARIQSLTTQDIAIIERWKQESLMIPITELLAKWERKAYTWLDTQIFVKLSDFYSFSGK